MKHENMKHETLSPLDLNHICSTVEAKSPNLKDRLSKKLDKKFKVQTIEVSFVSPRN